MAKSSQKIKLYRGTRDAIAGSSGKIEEGEILLDTTDNYLIAGTVDETDINDTSKIVTTNKLVGYDKDKTQLQSETARGGKYSFEYDYTNHRIIIKNENGEIVFNDTAKFSQSGSILTLSFTNNGTTQTITIDAEQNKIIAGTFQGSLNGNAGSATTVNITTETANDDVVKFNVGGGTGYNKTINNVAQLKTARKLKVDLANTTVDKTFNGSDDVEDIPVKGILPVGNGGTGQSDLANVTVGKSTNADNIKDKFGNYKELKNALLDMIYPVGSIYISTQAGSDTSTQIPGTNPPEYYKTLDPNYFLGGKWRRLKDKFLYAAIDGAHNEVGDKKLGDTAGSNDGYLLQHSHTDDIQIGVEETSQLGYFNIVRFDGPNQSVPNLVKASDGTYVKLDYDDTKVGYSAYYDSNDHSTQKVTLDFSHGHTSTKSGGVGDVTGVSITPISDATGQNMPQYEAVYMWERIE